MFFFNDEDEYIKVDNPDNETNIEKITINGLFNKKNVSLEFNKAVNIYIGENGLGKTTILNCIYYVLHGEYEKLIEIPFKEIIIKFKHEEEIKITKNDVVNYIGKKALNRNVRRKDFIFEIDHYLKQSGYDNEDALNGEDITDKIAIRLSRVFRIPYSYALSITKLYLESNNESENVEKKNIDKIKEISSKLISERILYLTTFRRIEKDYSEYFNIEKDRYYLSERMELSHEDNMLIRFGMNDVSKAIENILGIISDKTNQGFNKMTGILLSKYVNISSQKDSIKQIKDIDSAMLKIVLDRLEKQISEDNKNSILKLVTNKDIYNPEYQYLLDLIYELINSYNQLKIFDEKIISFKDTCNKYFNDKEFIYSQSDISLKLFSTDSKNEIELSMLSSGEKQIVSLFSKLYLEERSEKCILLIDEPELSISMRWQKMLLPDIVRSGNCKLLLTVTHSPFIFDNEFDECAKDMWYCFS